MRARRSSVGMSPSSDVLCFPKHISRTSENVAQGGFHARTEAGPARTWVAHGPADHGAARPPRAALGAAPPLGGAPRAALLPRASGALWLHVTERADAAPARAAPRRPHRAPGGRPR